MVGLHFFGAAIGLGMIVIGAALGIGKFAAAAAESIARQPNAADKITGAVNLPLFLLEGVAIIAEVGVLLIPIEMLGMFVRPFALTMRLAANMTGGHIAILTLLSLVFIFTDMTGRAMAGIGVGAVVSVPLAVGISVLEIIVVLVQAYVFTLLTAVFIGMAIHVHH